MALLKIQDDESIERICRQYRDGMGMREIGEVFNVSMETVRRILHRKKIPIRKKTVTVLVRNHNWENSLKQKGRLRGGYKPATHCKHGHELVSQKLIPNGRWWKCRVCVNKFQREWRRRSRANNS